jgi:uncharacterized membrane protein YqhA
MSRLTPGRPDEGHTNELAEKLAPLGRIIGRSRIVVLLAVVAVLLVAFSLFLLGTLMALRGLWHAWSGVLGGELGSADLTVEFLEIVSVLLRPSCFI